MDGTACARGSCPLEDDAMSFHFPLPPVTRLLFKPRRNLWYMCWSSMGKSRHLLSLSRCFPSLGERSLREWGASVRSPIFLVLLVSHSPTGLVRFLCIAFPTCIRTGAQWQLRYCFFVRLRRLWVHAVFKHKELGTYFWSISLPIVFPPRLLALPRDALLRRYLPTTVSLGPYE